MSVVRTSVRSMRWGAPSDREVITAALDRFEAAQAEVASLSFDALSAPEALNVKDRLERVYRRQGAVDHRLTHHLTLKPAPSIWAASPGPTCCPIGCASAAARPAAAWMKPTTGAPHRDNRGTGDVQSRRRRPLRGWATLRGRDPRRHAQPGKTQPRRTQMRDTRNGTARTASPRQCQFGHG